MPWPDRGWQLAVQTRVQVRRAQQREHDERVRPWLVQAAKLCLRGNALIDYLEANHVPAPQRVRRRLGLARPAGKLPPKEG